MHKSKVAESSIIIQDGGSNSDRFLNEKGRIVQYGMKVKWPVFFG